MNTHTVIAELVDALRLTGSVEISSYEELNAIQDVEPRAQIAEPCENSEGPFTVVCRTMTIPEAAAARGIVTYDTALPDGFIIEFTALAGDPRRQIVWCYDANLFGAPAAITAEGDALLALYEAELRRHLSV